MLNNGRYTGVEGSYSSESGHDGQDNNTFAGVNDRQREALDPAEDRENVVNGRHRRRPREFNGPGRGEPDFVRWPPGIQRRNYLRLFLRYLLLLDHLLMVFLFPFSVYNVLKILLTEVTFSNNDFVTDIASYCHYSRILSDDGTSVVFFKSGFGLLGKFHNIIVYYSAPVFVWASSKAVLGVWALKAYVSFIKTTSVAIYMAYGIGTSVYVCFATFFFALCFLMTSFRRYKDIARIMGHLYRTTVGVF
ncbi:LAFA_0E09076g1_1 [Lachancea sp. 'fantastica']|nr:LAFA_0E09076g1_1 [Lachancea sp. 'fantastica']